MRFIRTDGKRAARLWGFLGALGDSEEFCMKIRTRMIQASVLALAAGVSIAAMAQDGPGRADRERPRGGQLFEQADANKDGKVSKDEYNAAIASRFTALDSNRDGAVTEQELYQAGLERYKQRVAMRFKMMDRNSDGKVSADETPRRVPPFAVLDSNNDGSITKDDVRAMRAHHHRGHRMGGFMGGHGDGHRRGKDGSGERRQP
jgi:Ca2+-binding EF-hand superfamily protein